MYSVHQTMHTNIPCHLAYIIIQHSNKLEVPSGSIPIHNTVPLLGHEQNERKTQVGVHQGFTQTLTRLLGVSNLCIIGTLQTSRSEERSKGKDSTLAEKPYRLKQYSNSPQP